MLKSTEQTCGNYKSQSSYDAIKNLSIVFALRLDPGLASAKHYAETRKVVCLSSPGEEYVIEDFATAEYEPYESLDEPYNLYRAGMNPLFARCQND